MAQAEDLLTDKTKFVARIGRLSDHEQHQISELLNCIVNDFRNVTELFFKTKSVLNACIRISNTLLIDEAFKLIVEELCKTLKCDRVRFD